MAYLNTSSGLGGLFDSLTAQLDQQAKNNDQLRGLAAGGIVPASSAPGPSILSSLLGSVGLGQAQQPSAGPAAQPASPGPVAAPASAMPAAPMAFAPPSASAAPLSPPAPRAPTPAAPSPSFTPASSGPLPTFAAAGGAPGQDNTSKALAFYQSKGLSPLAASALVGGFHTESGKGLNTSATNVGDGTDGSNSIGIAQWNGDRARGLQQFAASNGLDPSNIDTQLQYSWLELNGPEANTLRALQSATNPAQATAAALGYERPAGWSAANPYGAKTFGSRLKNTVGLASTGFNTPFNGQPIGPNPSAFTPDPRQGDPLPMMAASGQGMSLPQATGFAPPPPTSAPAATASPVSSFAASPAVAPAQAAISAAAPIGGDPEVSVPGYTGTWSRAKIAAAPDGTDVPDDGELARAQAGSGAPEAVQVPRGGALVAPRMTSSAPAAPTPAAPSASDLSPARPTTAQVQALITNPETRQLGLQLWQQALTGKNYGFLQTGDGSIVRTDPNTGTVVPVYQGNKLTSVSAGTTLFDPTTRQAVYTAPTQDKTDAARPLTADEKASYGLPANGAFEMVGGKVMAVPGTYNSQGAAARNHVLSPGQVLVDDQGHQISTSASAPGAAQDPELVESLARRVYSGDTTALIGLGRGAAGSALVGAVQKRAGEIAAQYKGQPLPDFAESDILANRADQIGNQAGARASGTLNARLDTYAKEASGAMDLGIEASRNVPRTYWTPFNLAQQAVQRGSGDPNLAQFTAATNAIINTYAKAINPTGVPTVSDKAHASEVLSTAQSPEAYEATVRQLQREINIAHNAARGARAAERSGEAGQNMAVTSDSGTAPGSTATGVIDAGKRLLGIGVAPAASPAAPATDPLVAARDAIARGAPRDAVIQRLRQNNIDPGGL